MTPDDQVVGMLPITGCLEVDADTNAISAGFGKKHHATRSAFVAAIAPTANVQSVVRACAARPESQLGSVAILNRSFARPPARASNCVRAQFSYGFHMSQMRGIGGIA
jgi:hypothetical protein